MNRGYAMARDRSWWYELIWIFPAYAVAMLGLYQYMGSNLPGGGCLGWLYDPFHHSFGYPMEVGFWPALVSLLIGRRCPPPAGCRAMLLRTGVVCAAHLAVLAACWTVPGGLAVSWRPEGLGQWVWRLTSFGVLGLWFSLIGFGAGSAWARRERGPSGGQDPEAHG
jgi:hypothetical protein